MWKYFVKTILYCNVRNISELKKATYVKNCQLSSLKLSNFRTAETPLSKLLDWANSETNETKKGTFRNHSPFIYANEMNSKSENQLFRIWHKQLQNEQKSDVPSLDFTISKICIANLLYILLLWSLSSHVSTLKNSTPKTWMVIKIFDYINTDFFL